MTDFICSCCGRRRSSEQMIMLGGDRLCHACVEEYTTLCDRCGERVYRRDALQVNSRTIVHNAVDKSLKKSH